jgi:hypothetical protein
MLAGTNRRRRMLVGLELGQYGRQLAILLGAQLRDFT